MEWVRNEPLVLLLPLGVGMEMMIVGALRVTEFVRRDGHTKVLQYTGEVNKSMRTAVPRHEAHELSSLVWFAFERGPDESGAFRSRDIAGGPGTVGEGCPLG